MRSRLASIVPALALVSAVALPQDAPAARRPEQPIVLFGPGTGLGAFETWLVDSHEKDPDRVFTVVDQVDGAPAMRISGERWGGLVTREAFRDYRLVVEFRWGLLTWDKRKNAARDSGVLVHCQGRPGNTGKDGNGPWMRSIEAQVIEGGVGDFILVAGWEPDGRKLQPSFTVTAGVDRDGEPVFDPAGAPKAFTDGRVNWFGRDVDWKDTLGFRGRADVESPTGQWTRLEVIADGDKVTNLVNGTIVNRATGVHVPRRLHHAPVRRRRDLLPESGAQPLH
ncbi:MAG: DUF1080 domain-containing protein [Vicinamibacteria bacterium]